MHDDIRKFILDNVGRFCNCKTEKHLAVTACIVENIITYLDVDLNGIIESFAKRHMSTWQAVERILDKSFDVYDEDLYAELVAFTGTHPFTSRDALCDFALKLKAEYFSVTVDE